MTEPVQSQYFADNRRAAALFVHWLDDNDDGMKQILHEALELNRLVFLPLAVMKIAVNLHPDLLTKTPEIREWLLELAYSEVEEEQNNSD
ncbi:hypothetical protein R4P64_03370 [Rhodococcus sp. IEGM 1366]|uniref:hypothetical protein n=1 Tax=Rhodococcus sp. IEGM 1366 TaxID=3082223 RepID=UPI00295385B8|nr:hypothetical protein [Rhodococcus sp. IEGM 1366]MDV8065538.1 hypothetical protein [Rhodococcus sp. IEGM 1366]